jgi:hypothetical protein
LAGPSEAISRLRAGNDWKVDKPVATGAEPLDPEAAILQLHSPWRWSEEQLVYLASRGGFVAVIERLDVYFQWWRDVVVPLISDGLFLGLPDEEMPDGDLPEKEWLDELDVKLGEAFRRLRPDLHAEYRRIQRFAAQLAAARSLDDIRALKPVSGSLDPRLRQAVVVGVYFGPEFRRLEPRWWRRRRGPAPRRREMTPRPRARRRRRPRVTRGPPDDEDPDPDHAARWRSGWAPGGGLEPEVPR